MPADTFSTTAVPSGVYRVAFYPSTSAPANQASYKSAVRTGLTVTHDQVTDMGSTALQ